MTPRLRPLVRETPARVSQHRRRRGARARDAGRGAEILVALWLLARGWRIVAFRCRVQGVEIDILARKGVVLALVEVKARASLSEALAAVSAEQRARLRRAGAALAGRPGLGGLAIRLDLVALAPRAFPRHIADAWPDYSGHAQTMTRAR